MTKPFLKWAGGKRWLTARYPFLFDHSFDRYVEPFLGSGAVFFHLAPSSSVLADVNAELINLYVCLRDHHRDVRALLEDHALLHSDAYYYFVRDRRLRSPLSRAARFLYLNRTCWNGLYRENLKGVFNVPRGTKDTVIFDDDDFEAVSVMLQSAKIRTSDFESVLEKTRRGDFVFVDPPYTVRHNVNGFVKYNETIFSWADQERLARVLKRKADSGATYLVTNAYHQSVIDLYSEFSTVIPASRYSVLSGSSAHRGPTKEAIILIGCGWESALAHARSSRLRVGREAPSSNPER